MLNRLGKKIIIDKLFFIMKYIIMSIWCLLIFICIGWIFLASLSTTSDIFDGKLLNSGISFQNYYKAFVHNRVGIYFLNSIIYSSTSVIGLVLLCSPAAYAIARIDFKLNDILKRIFVLAMGVPGIMIVIPLFGIAATLKLINNRFILILVYIAMHIHFTIFFLISFFKNIPHTFEEAATMDGCSPFRAFWNIMFPLASPGIVTVSIFNFISIWNEYFTALIFANKTNLRPLSIGLFSMIQSMKYTNDFSGMFATVIIVLLPTIFIYIILSKKIISNITAGGINE